MGIRYLLRRIICPLKPDIAPHQSFSLLYIILIISTIILICFYSLPLNVNTSTLKPLNSKLIPTLENEKEISILRELFGEFPQPVLSVESTRNSLPVTSSSPEADVKGTTISQQTTENLSATESRPITKVTATTISPQKTEKLSATASKPKTYVTTSTVSPQKTESLSTSASTAKDEDLSKVFDNPTVTNYVTNKPKVEDNSSRQDNSKNQYSDTTEETKNTSTSNTEEESTVSTATRTVSYPGATSNTEEESTVSTATRTVFNPGSTSNTEEESTVSTATRTVFNPGSTSNTEEESTVSTATRTVFNPGSTSNTEEESTVSTATRTVFNPGSTSNTEEESTVSTATRTVFNPGSTSNTEEESTVSTATRTVFNPGSTSNTEEESTVSTATRTVFNPGSTSNTEEESTVSTATRTVFNPGSTINTEEESTVSTATRTVSNPGATNNPNGKKKTSRNNDSKSKSTYSSTDMMPEGEFLVFSDNCKIPNIDPYHPSILKYIEESPPLICKAEEPITKTKGNTLFIDKEAVRRRHLNISEITCLYHEIGRPKAGLSDNGIGLGFNYTFIDEVEIKAEFIRVICTFENKTVLYQGFHSFVHDKPVVEKRCNQHDSSGYSVLIVGIDAMSRLNMHRQLKKTSRYLLKDMEAVEMYGFNKIGDNTFPNLMALLTGYDERELKNVCWNSSRTNPLDKCNYAWKKYAKEGYRTFYAEDSPRISTFNYVKKGFQYQPTDYYLRHFMMVMEEILGDKMILNTYACVGNISETEVVLRWAEQFASHFKDKKYFSFSWINGLTHDFLNKGSAVDHLYEKLFRNLHTSGALNKTIVIVMGDHGMRWGLIRKTYIGRLEERLPMLLIALPPEFKREHPIETKALQLNSRRLVTPFDIHATLMNILHLDKNFTYVNTDVVDPVLAENYTARANTLFQPVPEDRSCDDASIDEHWCTCENSIPVDTDDKIVLKAANFLIDYINSLLKPVRNKCAVLKLKSITDARVWTALKEHQGHSLNDTILTIIVKVRPSKAIFEGTVRNSEPEMNQELLGTVSRLNLYGDQSACIEDAVLRKYCYCS